MRRVLRRLEWIHVIGFALVGVMLLTPLTAEASQSCCGTEGCACGATGTRLLQKLLLCMLQQSMRACACTAAVEIPSPEAASPVALPSESGHLEMPCVDGAVRWMLEEDASVRWFEDWVDFEPESIQPKVHGIRAPPGVLGNRLRLSLVYWSHLSSVNG